MLPCLGTLVRREYHCCWLVNELHAVVNAVAVARQLTDGVVLVRLVLVRLMLLGLFLAGFILRLVLVPSDGFGLIGRLATVSKAITIIPIHDSILIVHIINPALVATVPILSLVLHFRRLFWFIVRLLVILSLPARVPSSNASFLQSRSNTVACLLSPLYAAGVLN